MAWKTGTRQEKLMSEINITPFTDVMLVLLVIFMVTTPLMVTGSFKVRLPKAATAGAEPGKGAVVSVGASGEVSLNGRMIRMEDLAAALGDAFDAGGDRTVIVRADGSVRHSVIVNVLDTARAAGAERLSIATENERKKGR